MQPMLQKNHRRNNATVMQASGLCNQNAPRTNTNPYAKPALGNCYRCGKPDHHSIMGKLVNLVVDVMDGRDEGIIKDEDDKDHDGAKYAHKDGEQVCYVV